MSIRPYSNFEILVMSLETLFVSATIISFKVAKKEATKEKLKNLALFIFSISSNLEIIRIMQLKWKKFMSITPYNKCEMSIMAMESLFLIVSAICVIKKPKYTLLVAAILIGMVGDASRMIAFSMMDKQFRKS
jgi:hypothetical protein